MGNSQTKESGPADGSQGGRDRRTLAIDPSAAEHGRDRRRMSRPELGFLGISSSSTGRDRNRGDAPFERRETRQEREARRLERERVARLKERERSMREEHVDGGYLVTLGTYTGTEDFSKPVVRQLQIERRLAPFWRGLNDWSDNWAEHQLIAAARGLPIPAADAPPDPSLVPRPMTRPSDSSQNLQNLTVPMGPRTLSAASAGSGSGAPSPSSTGPGRSSPFKAGRTKALAAALSIGSRNASSTDLTPKEMTLPEDPFVNGQALEVFLYKDAAECPICFLSYPPYLNQTRCCDQPICSECFVQIKRSDPHLPEHHPDGQARDPNEGLNPEDPPEMLISEPSACPYCQQPEFGVTYEPPSFRRGLSYSLSTNISSATAMSSQSSLNTTLPHQSGRRRTHSLSANAPNVITTDRVRPDWATKLASARAHQARRAAAATALHTAAFLVGNDTEHRTLLRPGRFSRRNTGNNQTNTSADGQGEGASSSAAEGADAAGGQEGPRSERRNRMDELEDMMFMEAVRLSLAAEEERKRKEEKALRKEAKKREKEEKKALKKQGSHPYGGGTSGASGSSLSLSGFGRRRGNSVASNLRVEATVQGASQISASAEPSPRGTESKDKFQTQDDVVEGKGKEVDRSPAEASHSASEENSPAGSLPIPTGPGRTSSHLRQMSNASSLGSSFDDTPSGSYTGKGIEGEGGSPRASGTSLARDDSERDTGSEPMFNFRSLAEMVGVNIDDGCAREDEPDAGTSRLSQVKEDDKEDEEARAEHVEETKKDPLRIQAEGKDDAALKPDREVTTPELRITPDETSPTDNTLSEDKQFGNSSVTEKTTQITQ